MKPISERRAGGSFYTPPLVARYIVERTLAPLLECRDPSRAIHVLDPSCGDGVFLNQSLEYLRGRAVAANDPSQVPEHRVYGVDSNRSAVEQARRALGVLAVREPNRRQSRSGRSIVQVEHGDALVGATGQNELAMESYSGACSAAPPFDWSTRFPDVFSDQGGFDAIVGNPPYVNIRLLSRTTSAARRAHFRTHYRCARRGYDLYVLFVERSLELLREGGICGLIVPNKIATLSYAQACRRLLLEETRLLEVVDLSHVKIFADANVYPYILIWQKGRPAQEHSLSVRSPTTLESLNHGTVEEASVARRRQSHWTAEQGFDFHGDLDVESRIETLPLGDVATLQSGTTGFNAAGLATQLIEATDSSQTRGFPFIVSGCIDRYALNLTNVRFMKRLFQRAFLPADAAFVSAGKRHLYRNSKIVVAGMTRRLEAAWDPGGLAIGVQVYAITHFKIDPFAVLAILNSKLMTFLFQGRYRAKRLSGGYLAINKGQLTKLPFPIASESTARALGELAGLARQLTEQPHAIPDGPAATQVKLADTQIDETVYALFRLTGKEVALVESTVTGGDGRRRKVTGGDGR